MRGLPVSIALVVGCVPAGTSQQGEALFFEGGDEAPAPAPEEPPNATEEAPGAEELLALVEQRLLEAEPLVIEFEITVEGSVEGSVTGVVRFEGEDRMVLEARGPFLGQALDARLVADGESLRGEGTASGIAQPVPPALQPAVVLGFVRLGMLTHVVQLAAGNPPAHADGSLQEWVVLEGHRLGEAEAVDGHRSWPLSFDVEVDGEPRGKATLWLDASSGLPVRRRQVTRFGGGEIEVLERYTTVVAGGEQPR